MTIICKKHGKFSQEAGAHLRGQGCPKCMLSKGEREIAKWLKQKRISYEIEKRFADCRDKFPLPFDFFIESINACIEYDGWHHFYPHYKHSRERLAVTQLHDKMKTDYCKIKGIRLLRIPFFEMQKIPQLLENFFNVKTYN